MNLFTYKLNEFKNISGIYKITCTATGKFYIGSAKDIQHRLARHKSDLGRNVHHNILLQRAVNKYGKDMFEFEWFHLDKIAIGQSISILNQQQ